MAVSACAQHEGWENCAEGGYLVLHFRPSNENKSRTPSKRGPRLLPGVPVDFAPPRRGLLYRTLSILSMASTPPPYMALRPVRLLCIEGTGTVENESLEDLKKVVEGICESLGCQTSPHEVFDVIVGNNNSRSLCAFMLGRLKMSMDECKTAIENIRQRLCLKYDDNTTTADNTNNSTDLDERAEQHNDTSLDTIAKVLIDGHLPNTLDTTPFSVL